MEIPRHSIDSILINEELPRRASRPPAYGAENRSLLALAEATVDSPETALQKLAETAMALCEAGSAGISVEQAEAGTAVVRCRAAAGEFAPFSSGTMPRASCPCGTALDRNATLLMADPARHFASLGALGPKIVEVLLVPLHRGEAPVGTLWAVSHDPAKRFDAEDVRILEGLAGFASAALQAVEKREAAEAWDRKLRDALGRLDSALDAGAIATWTWDIPEDRVIADRNLARYFDVSTEDAEGGPIASYLRAIYPEDRDRVAAEIGRSLEDREIFRAEYRLIRPDGSLRWVAAQARPAYNKAGAPASLSGVLIDITDLKRTEVALRVSEEKYRTLFESIDEGFCIIEILSDDGRPVDYVFLEANPAFERQSGIERAVGRRMREIAPQHEDDWFEIYGRIAETGEPVRFEREAAALGRAFDVYAFRVDVPDRRRVAVLFNDITERKRAEAQLRASEERLRRIMAGATGYAILTLTADRAVTSWSPGAVAAFGYGEDEMIGRSGDILAVPEDRASGVPGEEFWLALDEGRAANERWHVRKDGTRFYAAGVLTPMGEGGSLGFVKILHDLTDRKHMEDELRRARDELELRVAERTADLESEIERRKDLTRRLATAQEDERRRLSRDLHDSIGQLLAGLSLAFKALEGAGELPPHAAGKLVEAKHVVEALGKEVHGLAVRLRPTSLDDIGLESALGQFAAEWSGRTGIRADCQTTGLGSGRLTPEVETTIYRVAQEALTNIAKHARAAIASVVVSRFDGYVTAVIEDDGIGFDPKATPAGRLGLMGMRERAALVGGELEVESEPGSGTTIYVRIPLP